MENFELIGVCFERGLVLKLLDICRNERSMHSMNKHPDRRILIAVRSRLSCQMMLFGTTYNSRQALRLCSDSLGGPPSTSTIFSNILNSTMASGVFRPNLPQLFNDI